MTVNVRENRRKSTYTLKENILRVAWVFGSSVFYLIPEPFYQIRVNILRLFGASIGPECQISRTCRVEMPWKLTVGKECAVGKKTWIYNLGHIYIGDRSVISHLSHLCAGTHCLSDRNRALIRSTIRIGNDCWVCSSCCILPEANLEDGTVVAAGSVYGVRDSKPYSVYQGNPATFKRKWSFEN